MVVSALSWRASRRKKYQINQVVQLHSEANSVSKQDKPWLKGKYLQKEWIR